MVIGFYDQYPGHKKWPNPVRKRRYKAFHQAMTIMNRLRMLDNSIGWPMCCKWHGICDCGHSHSAVKAYAFFRYGQIEVVTIYCEKCGID